MCSAYNRSIQTNEYLRYRTYGPDANGTYVWSDEVRTKILYSSFVASGDYNPHWRSQVKEFQDASTPYTALIKKVKAVPGDAWSSQKLSLTGQPVQFYTRRGVGHFLDSVAFPNPASTLDSRVTNAARARANQKISEFVRPFQGGVFLGELRETLHMLRNPLLSLRKGLGTLLEMQVSRAKGVRIPNATKRRRAREKILSDTWLEWVFGIRPLLSDIESLCNALAQNNYYAANRCVVRASSPVLRMQDDAGLGLNDVTEVQLDGAGVFSVTRTSFTEASCRIVVGIEVVRNSNAVFDPTLFGFGTWREFVPTVWELIPYSFLVDYFTNIGDVAASFAVMPSSIRWSSQTVKRKNTYLQAGGPPIPARCIANVGASNWGGAGGFVGALTCETTSFARTNPGSSLTVTPEVRFNLSWLRSLNILALGDQHRKARLQLTT